MTVILANIAVFAISGIFQVFFFKVQVFFGYLSGIFFRANGHYGTNYFQPTFGLVFTALWMNIRNILELEPHCRLFELQEPRL